MTTMIRAKNLEKILYYLPSLHAEMIPGTPLYQMIAALAKEEAKELFSKDDKVELAPFGSVAIPYFKMGAIDSVDLFGLDELIIFSFYWVNRKRYKKVVDIGANLGLHSIIMDLCGFEVTAYEPDSIHFAQLSDNLVLNQTKNVHPLCAAVSSRSGTANFVRVLGNTTSSHIEGSKNPYGDLEKYEVPVVAIQEITDADLMKIDAEGHEKDILLAIDPSSWKKLDVMVEVGSQENAQAIFEYLKKNNICAFAQKKGWKKVTQPSDMPYSHRDGSLFITSKPYMPWDEA